MFAVVKKFVRYMALEKGRMKRLYLKLCRPDGTEYALFLKKHGHLHAIGEHCSISPRANITDPAYLKIGNNVRLSDCAIFGHDGSVNMINRAYGLNIDSVGRVEIRDNSFVGHGVLVMPGVTIGPDSVVAAGSVVTKDVPPGMVVGGIPAKVIGTTAAMVERLKARSITYPWRHLIEQRKGSFDAAMEPELRRRRVEFFYPK